MVEHLGAKSQELDVTQCCAAAVARRSSCSASAPLQPLLTAVVRSLIAETTSSRLGSLCGWLISARASEKASESSGLPRCGCASSNSPWTFFAVEFSAFIMTRHCSIRMTLRCQSVPVGRRAVALTCQYVALTGPKSQFGRLIWRRRQDCPCGQRLRQIGPTGKSPPSVKSCPALRQKILSFSSEANHRLMAAILTRTRGVS